MVKENNVELGRCCLSCLSSPFSKRERRREVEVSVVAGSSEPQLKETENGELGFGKRRKCIMLPRSANKNDSMLLFGW